MNQVSAVILRDRIVQKAFADSYSIGDVIAF